MKTAQDFAKMGYNSNDISHLMLLQQAIEKGITVSLIVDHHTDEDLLESIEEKQLDTTRLEISDVEWESGQIRFKDCEGWANFGEVIPF